MSHSNAIQCSNFISMPGHEDGEKKKTVPSAVGSWTDLAPSDFVGAVHFWKGKQT